MNNLMWDYVVRHLPKQSITITVIDKITGKITINTTIDLNAVEYEEAQALYEAVSASEMSTATITLSKWVGEPFEEEEERYEEAPTTTL